MNVCLVIHRSGVWLQSDQPVPAGEHISAQLCQNVHRPCGEHRYEPAPISLYHSPRFACYHSSKNHVSNDQGYEHRRNKLDPILKMKENIKQKWVYSKYEADFDSKDILTKVDPVYKVLFVRPYLLFVDKRSSSILEVEITKHFEPF